MGPRTVLIDFYELSCYSINSQLLTYLSNKQEDTLKLKQRKLDMEERKFELQEKRLNLQIDF